MLLCSKGSAKNLYRQIMEHDGADMDLSNQEKCSGIGKGREG
jgi:hypothetical protein